MDDDRPQLLNDIPWRKPVRSEDASPPHPKVQLDNEIIGDLLYHPDIVPVEYAQPKGRGPTRTNRLLRNNQEHIDEVGPALDVPIRHRQSRPQQSTAAVAQIAVSSLSSPQSSAVLLIKQRGEKFEVKVKFPGPLSKDQIDQALATTQQNAARWVAEVRKRTPQGTNGKPHNGHHNGNGR